MFNIGNFSTPKFVGFIEEFNMGPKEISISGIVASEHPALRFLMGFQMTVCMNVRHLGKFLCVATNKNRTVTIQRIFLSTHQRNYAFSDANF